MIHKSLGYLRSVNRTYFLLQVSDTIQNTPYVWQQYANLSCYDFNRPLTIPTTLRRGSNDRASLVKSTDLLTEQAA